MSLGCGRQGGLHWGAWSCDEGRFGSGHRAQAVGHLSTWHGPCSTWPAPAGGLMGRLPGRSATRPWALLALGPDSLPRAVPAPGGSGTLSRSAVGSWCTHPVPLGDGVCFLLRWWSMNALLINPYSLATLSTPVQTRGTEGHDEPIFKRRGKLP